jgi:hypothetical protein
MTTGQAIATQKNKTVASQPASKRVREKRTDDAPAILPDMEHFVSLLRKVARPSLAVQLLEQASGTDLPELKALTKAKDKLKAEARQAIFHAVAKLNAPVRMVIERAAERVLLLDDDYGGQAVYSLLNDERKDDAAILAQPSDRNSRALYLFLLQTWPVQGAQREDRFDHAEQRQVMHRQWKSDQYSSHYLGPKGVAPSSGVDVQEVLRARIAELFPKVPKDQILIEQFTRRDSTHEQEEEDDEESQNDLYTLTATFNGSTAHYRQVENSQVVDHEVPAAMSAGFSWEPQTGALSVFCEDKEKRRELATIFRDVVLADDGDIADMPMREFDLLGFATSEMLKRMQRDRIAGIEDISILQIKVARLLPQKSEASGRLIKQQLSSKMEISRDRRDGRHIYQVAYDDYGIDDLSGYSIVQVKLAMRISGQLHRRAHNVAVQITAPNGLNDKSRTEDDRKRVLEQLTRIGVLTQF